MRCALTRGTCLGFAALVLLTGAPTLRAAYTEPRLALMRVTTFHTESGRITLQIDGSFSFADALQLALPLAVTVTQGALTARFDLAGNVFTSTAAAPEQPAPGPGVIAVAPRRVTLVLPPGFSSGPATAQVVATYDGQAIASNRLQFTL